MKLNRREVLKKSGIGVTGTALMVSAGRKVSAEEDLNGNYQGISYHSYSHEVQDSVTATFSTDSNLHLTGRIQVAGFDIPLNGIKPYLQEDEKGYQGRYDAGKDNSIIYELIDEGPYLVGKISKPSPRAATIGITIHSENSGVEPIDIKGALDPEPERIRRANLQEVGIPDALEPSNQA